MLIGLISDTHIPDRAKELPQNVLDAFNDVDMIIHAGDLTSLDVIEKLEETAPVMAVQGNMMTFRKYVKQTALIWDC